MSGHGHVTPNPDGRKARCGGPGICAECSKEAVQKYGLGKKRPTIVCLCGSTRFSEAFREANLLETLRGNIVLTIGCDTRSDADLFNDPAFLFRWHPAGPPDVDEIKAKLDELHLRKIDLADEVLILNVGGYIGESTGRELAYAHEHGKRVRYLEGGAP